MLRPGSQSGRQDEPDQEARTSSDHQCASGSCGETRGSNIDNRMPGILPSTVGQQDTNRRETVKNLIQQFENHPNKEPFLQDLKKTQEINAFRERSMKLITDMGNTEIFELCETSSKIQCPGKVALFYCSSGRSLKHCKGPHSSTRRTVTPLSMPGYVIKKNLTHSAKHGASERQRMYRKAKEMSSPTEAWWFRKYLSDVGWAEEQINQYDKIALEDHSKIATPKERTRNEKNRVLSLNKEGAQGPLNECPVFVEAKRELKRLLDEYVKETSEGNTPIHPIQRTRQRRDRQFEGLEEYDYQIDPRTGWRSYPSKSQGNLRHPTSSFFISLMETARRLEVEQKLEFSAIFILD